GPERRWTQPPLTFAGSPSSLSEEFRRQDHATSGKPGWMQFRMIQSWRILEPRNLILLFPIRDATPMSAAGFAGVASEAAILNYIIGHAEPTRHRATFRHRPK